MAEHDFTQSVDLEAPYVEPACDSLSRKAGQLHAMLALVVGDGFVSFNDYSDAIREKYLWACQDLASEIEKLSGLVVDRSKWYALAVPESEAADA